MRVSVSGKQFVFPRQCACCGAYPLTHLSISGAEKNKLSRTKGWVFEIPYCVNCKGHVKKHETLMIGWLAAIVLSTVTGLVVIGLVGNWEFGISLSAALMVLVSALAFLAITWLKRTKAQNCWDIGRSVSYLGSDRSCHSFDIKSTFYAKEFVIVNHRKLVNISPRVAGMLRTVGFGDFQVPRRVIRRRD